MNKNHYELLTALLSQPTAPFRECYVIDAVAEILAKHAVPFFIDPVGNIVVGVNSRMAYQRLLNARDNEPVRVFIAHMDHPGFHGARWLSASVLRVRWHGGSPTRLVTNSKVWLSDERGWNKEGTLRNVNVHRERYGINSADVHLKSSDTKLRRPPAQKLFGGFKFRNPVWKSGSLLYTKAADDLVGVFCVVATALEVFGKRNAKKQQPFIGLLTRGEEVGFIGAIGHFELGWLQKARRPVLCVSLEASRTLPGAKVGKGPVLRLGDRRTMFHSGGMQLLTELAEKVLPKQYQRRVMDGGTCEGTAATAYGFPTIALSVPLGNYHNEGYEGGPDCRGLYGPAPEFVHLDDVEGQRKLCSTLMRAKLPWSDPWRHVRKRLKTNYLNYRSFL